MATIISRENEEGFYRVLLDGRGLFLAAARGGFDFAGLIDDAGEFFDDAFAGEALGFGEIDEGNVGTAEEFFHVLGAAAGLFFLIMDAFFKFDGTDGAEGFFVAEDEIDGFVVDEAEGGIPIL